MSASPEIVEDMEEAELTNVDYGANSFIKVTPTTVDYIGSQSQPSACNTVKKAMYSKSWQCIVKNAFVKGLQ